ncbi:hypothetical protein BH18CHL2_BH18CHL2_08170 [soil metagenome]
MRRPLILLFAAILVAVACASGPPGEVGAGSPTPSADIKRSKLDIAYSALAEEHYAKPSSKELLTAALEAFRAEARSSGGKAEGPTPDFQDATEPVPGDFKKFADAAMTIAAQNPQVSADRFADAGILAMLRVKPDCHSYYRPRRAAGLPAAQAALAPGGGATHVAQADEAGLEYRIVAGNVGYVAWREFRKTGTYDITTEVKKALDALLARGAAGWVLDLRANVGGDPSQTMISWFLDGEPIMDIRTKTGSAGIVTAKKELRLPAPYQLPIAMILNGRSGSSPEVLALGLKENKRTTIVGQKSAGCLGATDLITMTDGSLLGVSVQEFVGAVTGARYNNAGIPPDVPADEAAALEAATRIVQEQITQGRGP